VKKGAKSTAGKVRRLARRRPNEVTAFGIGTVLAIVKAAQDGDYETAAQLFGLGVWPTIVTWWKTRRDS
jgi:hypothetical protein